MNAQFRALFEAHVDYIMKSLRRLGVRPGDVEDLAHEVFVTVLRRWDTYDPSRPPRPWLFAFALRMASAYRQSAYVRREALDKGETGDAGERGAAGGLTAKSANAEGLLVERQESALVYRALEALDYDKRVVFTMFELDERTAADIAAELELPQNTVFSRLRAAREEFTVAVRRLSREPVRPSRPMERPYVD